MSTAEAEAEGSAVASGTLDAGTHEALLGIEALKGEIALRATTTDVNALRVEIEKLKTFMWRAVVVFLAALITALTQLALRLFPALTTPT